MVLHALKEITHKMKEKQQACVHDARVLQLEEVKQQPLYTDTRTLERTHAHTQGGMCM